MSSGTVSACASQFSHSFLISTFGVFATYKRRKDDIFEGTHVWRSLQIETIEISCVTTKKSKKETKRGKHPEELRNAMEMAQIVIDLQRKLDDFLKRDVESAINIK
ncbi:unnamed protein product [Caenorhabditis angaria]|uniref:Uncharacterized protein n=1 Tax=Caenorhabditis angaria TaxID=860376 RepID=A0A9P1IJT1_9PELO|nr:unnamed protein product [Caenorhabditis angaria]